MLNALVDILGAVLDRVSTLIVDHWIALLVVVLALSLRRLPWRRRALDGIPDAVALTLIVVTSVALSAGGAAIHGMPLPEYHDDFANLLDAGTLLQGRFSNPTHPLWPHFETMHVLQVPRYTSKYPIGHGLVFAAGTLLLGHPLRAVWIVAAAACGALWWALRVWTTRWLALLGGLAVAVHPTFLEWTESYHGGALTALGGALLFAAAGRFVARPSSSLAAVMGAGVVMLAITRPYEGLVFVVAMAVFLALHFRRDMIRAAPAGMIIIASGMAFIAYHNWSVTGSPLQLRYSLYERQYDPAPNFLWERARPMPHYRNAEMARIYRVDYLGQYLRVHAPGGLVDESGKKIAVIERALLGRPAAAPLENAWPLFLALLVALIAVLRTDRQARQMVLILLLFAFAPFSIIWWLQLHYLAPAAAVAVCLTMLLVRRMFDATPVLAIAVVVLFFANAAVTWANWMHSVPSSFEPRREAIARSLRAMGGLHLVIVAPDVFDAVYNAADLDGAPVVWARDLGAAADARLISYYGDRRVWWLGRAGIRRY